MAGKELSSAGSDAHRLEFGLGWILWQVFDGAFAGGGLMQGLDAGKLIA